MAYLCNRRFFIFSVFFFLLSTLTLYSESQPAFKVVVLGAHGGPKDCNLSSYLLAPKESNDFIALDAGTLLEGIYIANSKNSFEEIKINPDSDLAFEIEILRNHIKAYLISHAHLDHVAGLVINSTADSKKPIFGVDSTIDFMRDNLFNWQIWPNFAGEGKKPWLNKYQYKRLKIGQQIPILDTEMRVEPFLLSHPNGYQSTAFLIEHRDSYVVYFGDTDSDALESKKHLEKVWKKIAPLISQNKFRGMFLESSYQNKRPTAELFGHLNPKYMMEELNNLARLVDPVNPQTALKNLKIIVTHIKESVFKGASSKEIIEEELNALNNLDVQFIFPEQGERLEL